MDSKKVQLNVEIPPEIRREFKRIAKRKGLNIGELAARVLRAYVQSESEAEKGPDFLAAWERLLVQFLAQKS